MLALHRSFGTMRPDWDQSEQCIQVKSPEGAGVVANPQVPFPHQRLDRGGNADCGDGDRNCESGIGRINENNSAKRQQQFEQRLDDVDDQARQLPLSWARFFWTPICPTGGRCGEIQHEQDQAK